MKFENRLHRLSEILRLLSCGDSLSTPQLVDRFNVSKKIIQTDFKEYLLPLFDDGVIYYDYSSKCYVAKYHFLSNTNLALEELATMAIIKNKSKDKYSDDGLAVKVDLLYKNYDDALSHSIYTLTDIERIDKFKSEIIQIKHAIQHRRVIECIYRNKVRQLHPLEILNLDGYWYLVCFDTHYKDIRKYHLNSITKIVEKQENFTFEPKMIASFQTAINAYFKPELEPITVVLFLDNEVSKYFQRKPISTTQRVMKIYEDESCDIELTVTDLMEIIPTIQKFMPHIGVVEPTDLKDALSDNVRAYLKYFE